MKSLSKFLPAILLLLFVVQSFVGAVRNSVTADEYVHLPVGLHMWRAGDLSQDPANPPLSPMIAALPLLLSDARLEVEADFSHWDIGFAFMQQNADAYHRLFVLSRALMIGVGVLLGVLVFAWAKQLYGRDAAIAALFLYSFSPTMLAHAPLASLDFPGAAGFTLACYCAWKFAARQNARLAMLFGVSCAVAVLLKLSAAILIPVLGGIVLFYAWRERAESGITAWRWAKLVGIAAIAAWLALLAGYAFQEVFAPLASGEFERGGFFARLAEKSPGLRLPFPMALIDGIDSILYEGKTTAPTYFFAGELSTGEDWWHYHLAAFLLKTPLAVVIAGALAMAMWFARRDRAARAAFLFVPILAVFIANALFNSRLIGVRHTMPAYPLLFIAASPWFAAPIRAWLQGRRGPRAIVPAALSVAGLAWFLIANLTVAPRYIQYFNEVAGGPNRGHYWLIDSNLDWGQDLIRLREYMDARGIERIHLAYFGTVHPAIYGIDFVPLERGAKGTAAVSVTFLMGRPYYWYRATERGSEMQWVEAGTYTWLRELEPVDRVGAMFIYDLD